MEDEGRGKHTHTHSPRQWGDIKMGAFTPRTLAVVPTHQASKALFRRANFLWPPTATLWLSPCHKKNILYYTISPMDTVCIIMTKHKRRKAERFRGIHTKGKLVGSLGSITPCHAETYKRMRGKTCSKRRGQGSPGSSTWPKGVSNVIKIIIARKESQKMGRKSLNWNAAPREKYKY